MTNDIFGTVPIEELESLLRDDKLNSSEEELFSAMEEWAGNDQNRQGAVASILHVVRFTLMTAEFFNERVMTSDLAKQPGFTKKLNAARYFGGGGWSRMHVPIHVPLNWKVRFHLMTRLRFEADVFSVVCLLYLSFLYPFFFYLLGFF